MLTKNDTNSEPRKWVNGTLATIHELKSDYIKVKIKDKIFTVGKNRWEKYDYKIDGGSITHKVVATFLQYPLKLAWASTIHKCQGQTFDKVAIDFDSGSFAHGQTYVALSRARSIEGIYLMREITFKDLIFDNKVFNFLGTELEKKYMDEIDNKKNIKKVTSSKKIEQPVSDIETVEWSKEDDKKLIMLYKKNVPEHALANIFKKRRTEIRARILKLLG
jgi:ATP-dependent exoDNAse (exonuclease V) alpha subunit